MQEDGCMCVSADDTELDYPDGGKAIRPSRVHGLRDAGSSSIQGSLLFPFPFPLGSLS